MSDFDPNRDEDRAYLASALVAYALGLHTEDILAVERGSPAICRARHIAMYLMHAGLGLSLGRVARAFGRDRSTIGHACRQIEAARDNDDFDVWLDQLTVGLASVVGLGQLRVTA